MNFKLSRMIAAVLLLSVSVAWPDSFFVTNPGINTITKYDENGVGTPFTASFVKGPNGIVLDSGGNVYVSTRSNTIEKFAPDGSSLGVFAATGLSNPRGLAFDQGGNLYAANFDGNTVVKFGPEGDNLGVFGSVTQPTGLAFDLAGNLYVASSANVIQRFAPDGGSLPAFTSPALNQPQGLALDAASNLYVANSGSNLVETFSPDGADLGLAKQSFAAPPASSSGTQDVHIAFRTDGLPGDGSFRNPFDGSTQEKLDAVFKSYYDARVSNINFRIGPGTFQMKGSWDSEWQLLNGWHVYGAGRLLTKITQVVGVAGTILGSPNGAVFTCGYGTKNQTIQDLSIDCAWFRSGPGGDNSRPHGNFRGCEVGGANSTLRNVTVTGAGWADAECFVIFLAGDATNLPDNAIFENVEVSDCATGIYSTRVTGMAMINGGAMASNPNPVYAKNGRIINCTFNLPYASNAGGMPAGYDGGIVTGCSYIGYHFGIYQDTFTSKNITIVGNGITALYPDGDGILLNIGVGNTACEHITAVGNTVYSSGGIAFASGVKNSSVLGNRIHIAPGTNPNYGIFLDTSSVQNIAVGQNTIDPGLPWLNRGTKGCTFAANRTPAGMVAIPDTIQGGNSAATLSYGLLTAFAGGGLGAPMGLAFDSSDALHIVNSNHSSVEKSAVNPVDNSVTTTGSGSAFIAIQRASRLANISTRLNILTGDKVLAGGFIVVGAGTKRVLIRGLGPSLAAAGVGGTLADPVIELHDGSTGAIVASNDNWKDSQRTEIEAAGIPAGKEAEAALVTTLSAGAYTVIESGRQNTTGVGLLEIYDLGSGSGPELANISTRGFVDTGGNVMIAGFIATSSSGGSSRFIVRALGPSLGAAGLSGTLVDPVLELHDSNGSVVASNDNWSSDQQTEIQATGIPPTGSAEAAIVATLAPGAYTAIESGRNGGTGIGLVEVYNLH